MPRTTTDKQLPWIDDLLWKWGAWVREHNDIGYPESTLGRMHRQRMKELKVWDSEPPETRQQAGEDTEMIEVDRAIAGLPKRLQRLVKWRYWHGVTMCTVAQRIHRSTPTANRWLIDAQQHVALLLSIR